MKTFLNPFCHILEKLNIYHFNEIISCNDALKNYGASKFSNACSEIIKSGP